MLGRMKQWGLNRDIVMLGLARMADSFGTSQLIVLIPLFVADFGVTAGGLSTPFVIGILLSVYGVFNFLGQPTVGVWMDRVGRRKPFLMAGLGGFSLATAGFIWVRSFLGLSLLRMVQGLSVALTLPPSLALMTEYTRSETRGTAMGFYNVMRLTGFAIGPLVAGFFVYRIGFDAVLILGAGATGLSLLLVEWLVREPDRPVERRAAMPFGQAMRAFFSRDMADFGKLALANLTMALSISLIAPLENQFNRRLEQTPAEFGVAFSALIVTMIVFQIPIGRMADTLGRRIMIVSGLAFLVPVTIGMGYVRTTGQFVTLRALQGLSVAAVAAPSFALGGDKSRAARRGRELSLLTMAFGLGIGLGPVLAGYMAGRFAFETPFWLGSGLVAASAVLVVTVTEEVLIEEESLDIREID